MPAYSLLVPNVWWLSCSVGIWIAFCAEAFGTAFLAFCIFALTHPKNIASKNNVYVAPLIGATVGDLIALFAPFTQAGFNP
jgi:glycerol uptake facilitator-like aquaporin